MPKRLRTLTPQHPEDMGRHDGLAYALFSPPEPRGAVLVLHGAGSCKESHYPWARACRAAGFAALCFDQRGHGESGGALGAGALDDVAAMAAFLGRAGRVPLALRGSSMGGALALLAAERAGATAVIAICPASAPDLLRGLRAEAFTFGADRAGLEALLERADVGASAEAFGGPVLLLHAEGDEQVPVAQSRALAERLGDPRSRLIVVPGGHHRSVQRDPELQAVALRWLEKALV